MVRLERILYERAVNNNALGRARKIVAPKLWYKNGRKEYNSTVFWPGQDFISRALESAMKYLSILEYKNFYQMTKCQGVPVESFLAMREEDWRRGVLAENMKRENLHPHSMLIQGAIRCRYWKVDKYQPGFEVPDYIVEQTHAEPVMETRTYSQGIWALMSEYQREMMPRNYLFKSRRVLLDFAIFHELINRENWNRLFYNEGYYTAEVDEAEAEEEQRLWDIDYTDPVERKNFKFWMERQLKDYPGFFAREGDAFDYETFFRNHTAMKNHVKPNESMSRAEIDAWHGDKQSTQTRNSLYSNEAKRVLKNDFDDEEVIENKNTVGTKMPEEITPMKYKAWMA